MEGAGVFTLLVSAAIGLVMLIAQLRLFSIATALEQLLRQLGSNLPIGGDCPHCGGRLVAGKPVCRHCGRDVPVAADVAPPSPAQRPLSGGEWRCKHGYVYRDRLSSSVKPCGCSAP
jgi:hypothetical protein